jgi:hypothetical protein
MKRIAKPKLNLGKQTIRTLEPKQLAEIAGGLPTEAGGSLDCTRGQCTGSNRLTCGC